MMKVIPTFVLLRGEERRKPKPKKKIKKLHQYSKEQENIPTEQASDRDRIIAVGHRHYLINFLFLFNNTLVPKSKEVPSLLHEDIRDRKCQGKFFEGARGRGITTFCVTKKKVLFFFCIQFYCNYQHNKFLQYRHSSPDTNPPSVLLHYNYIKN